MPLLRAGVDHYQIVSDSRFESDASAYGVPCILADEETGDILFAYLDIPAEDGTIRGAMGLGAVVYRLDLPDREEETVVEDLPDGFDFEQEDGYESPFDDEEEGATTDGDGDGDGDGDAGNGDDDAGDDDDELILA